MEKDYLDEKHLFDKQSELEQLKTGFNWLLIVLSLDGLISLIYFVVSLMLGKNYYMNASPSDLKSIELMYNVFSYLFVIEHVTLETIAAVKIKHATARLVMIILGVVHLVSFVYYEFLRDI